MVLTVYADGSAKGWLCVVMDLEEGFFRTFFKRTRPSMYFEYHAVLFALEVIPDTEEPIVLYNDSQGVIDHVNQVARYSTSIVRHLASRIRRTVRRRGLDVTFRWSPRDSNLAGLILETAAPRVLLREE